MSEFIVTIEEEVVEVLEVGYQGEAGPAGADGAQGAPGPAGADGVGIPAGGTAGQVLKKVDAVDYNTTWGDEQDISGKLNISDIDDTPVNGETAAPISSNWAFDHAAQQTTDLAAKLAHTSGTATGIKETQVLTHDVTGAGQTKTLDYAAGNVQYINASTGDAFTIAFSNWPTTESGSMTLIVEPDAGITVGAPTWPTTRNAAPDFTGITAGTGYGIYEIFFANGNAYVFVVEEV